MLITDVLVLESGLAAEAVRARLGMRPSDAVVLVRRRPAGGVRWHRIAAGELRRLAVAADRHERLGALVRLDALNEVPVVTAEQVAAGRASYGVVVDGDTVVGFLERRGSQALGETAPGARQPDDGYVVAPGETLAEIATDRLGVGVDELLAANPELSDPDLLRPGRVLRIPGAAAGPAPWRAAADVAAPARVAVDEVFTVRVGVRSATTAPADEAIALVDLPPAVTVVPLDVHLVTGLDIVDGSEGRGRLEVDRATLDHQPLEFRLRPGSPPATADPEEGGWVERLQVTYGHRGSVVGVARRSVAVGSAEAAGEPGVAPLRIAAPAEDLTITILRAEDSPASGAYRLLLASPHLDAPVPAQRLILGADAATFAGWLIQEVERHPADPLSWEVIEGLGQELADLLPEVVWDTLTRVAAATGAETEPRVPDVLLITDEGHIPWELAWMPRPLDPGRPPLLGAQVNLGRWLADAAAPADPGDVDPSGIAVVVGHYAPAAGVRPLPKAEEEANLLAARRRARIVAATRSGLDHVLAGHLDAPPFDVTVAHFAGHGRRAPDTGGAYLMLDDGSEVSPFVFRSARLARSRPAFVFLNACQVGTAAEMLGRHAGIAGFAVRAGFHGFVAPLWSVDDALAQQVALDLYAQAADGIPVAAYLREVRQRFAETEDTPAATSWLAYVYYGHPRLRLVPPE